MSFQITENEKFKKMTSSDANYIFNKINGQMITWGKTLEDDAEKFPGPTIADIEITTSCDGVKGQLCSFCYKANNPHGKNMSFETFQKVFDNLPKTITQIAFGADSKAKSNPDIWKIMEYSKNNGVIPNITVAEIDDKVADKLAFYCGAVAVSRYADKDVCYDSVKKLTNRGMKQVNIHMMISEDTYDRAVETVYDMKDDERLSKMNAIVFLSLKQKGRGVNHSALSQEKFNELVRLSNELDISYGFDSCSSLKFFKSLSRNDYEKFKGMIMPCESTLESSYINVDGNFFPCSFMEGTEKWKNGLDVENTSNFINAIWNNERVEEFRQNLLETKKTNCFDCRDCPYYKI